MTRYAIVFGGVVNSTPEYDSAPEFAPPVQCIELSEDSPVEAGWRYVDGEFLEPLIPEPESVVPEKVTMRQARLALHKAGILSSVQSAIDDLPDPHRTEAQIEWDYSSEMYRHRDFVQMLGSQLGLTEEQIDDLFIQAATL